MRPQNKPDWKRAVFEPVQEDNFCPRNNFNVIAPLNGLWWGHIYLCRYSIPLSKFWIVQSIMGGFFSLLFARLISRLSAGLPCGRLGVQFSFRGQTIRWSNVFLSLPTLALGIFYGIVNMANLWADTGHCWNYLPPCAPCRTAPQ